MKNIFLRFSFVCFFLSGIHGFAQEVQLATLQQGENLRVFYGGNALIDALTAAKTGDLITLSAGVFTAPTITKVVTIQGAGYVADVEKGRYPTVINGNTTIKLTESDEGLLIEGLYFNGHFTNTGTLVSCTVSKCLFYASVNLSTGAKHCSFIHCRIYQFNPDQASENLYLKNSIIYILGNNLNPGTLMIQNSFIYAFLSSVNAVFSNNIIRANDNYYGVGSYSITYNNVFFDGNKNAATIQSGNSFSDIKTLFGKDALSGWNIIEDYQLTEEAQSSFLGTDGTQVGIYGGSFPFSDVPSNLQITKKEIDAKSSPDGKLKVNITVE